MWESLKLPSSIHVHKGVHTEDRSFLHMQCGMGFSYSHDIKIYEQTHNREEPCVCCKPCRKTTVIPLPSEDMEELTVK